MAYVVMKVITAIIWIIVFVMILGVIKLDITPLLATLGVASLGLFKTSFLTIFRASSS
jgi:small-conductance mechanosensitive channel